MQIIRSVHSLTGSPYTVFIPGYTPDNSSIIIPTSATLDFLTVLSPETLFAMQDNLEQLVSNHILALDAVLTPSQLWALASGSAGVNSIQADSSSPMFGAITLASGTNIDLVESSGTITFDSVPFPAFIPSTVRYVDGVNGNDSNTGGSTAPFKTIQAALDSIGSATNSTEWNDVTTARLILKVAPGIYTETIQIPIRQIVAFDLDSAIIFGDVNWNFDASVLNPGPVLISQPLLIFRGNDFQPSYTGAQIPLIGIRGNLNIEQSNADPTFGTLQVHIIKSGVTGNITFSIGTEIEAYSSQVFIEDGMIIGDLINTEGVSTTLFAANCDTSASHNLGGINGEVNLYVLRNVRFSSAVITSGNAGGRWFNVSFPALSHDFSTYTGTVSADANSFASFQTNVPSKGTFPFTLLDSSNGVAYTPTTSSNWGATVPTTVQQALDLLAVKNAPVS